MGIRVEHAGACIPPPSRVLIDDIAQQLHDAAVYRQPKLNPEGWAHSDHEVVTDWQFLAKVAYGVIAVHGGARKVKL